MSVTINQALYGTGVYGTAQYGQFIVTINTGVSATSNIGTTTQTATANTTLTGVSATALTRTLHINAFEVDITEPLYGPNGLTGSIGTLEFANTVTPTGVVGTGQIGTVSLNIAFGITGVGATGSVNTVLENVTEKVTGVVGTFTLNAAGLDIRSVNRVPVTGDVGTTAVGTIQVNISEYISSVSAVGQIGTIKPNVAESVTGVVGTSSVNTVTATGTANTTLTGVEGVGQIGEVEDQPLERIATGVQATGAIGTVGISNSFTITGVVGTFSVGTLTATGVIFDFEAVKTLYDRRRTAYVEKQLPRVVYVDRQSTVAERRAAA